MMGYTVYDELEPGAAMFPHMAVDGSFNGSYPYDKITSTIQGKP